MKRLTLVTLLGSLVGSAAFAQDSAALPAPAQNATATQDEAAPAVDTSDSRSRRAANDRIDLDTTVVTGNRELPKVLYIVPWKKAELGELPAQPFNTLLDEVLTPVDRDVFRREVTYYGAIAEGVSEKPAADAASSQTSRAQ